MEMEELSMDTEKMKQDLGGGAVFDIGEPNTAFAALPRRQSIIGISITKAVRSCL